jgi:PTH1 family peptidyl-tRNA hydrolase
VGPTRLIVGLGNPGAEYAGHRHNLGFRCLDLLADRSRLRFSGKRAHSLVARGQFAGHDVALAKPQTYMNESGAAVKQLMAGWGVPARSLLVVYDDVDLPPGTIRLRAGGGPGTHNGMRSIVDAIGSTAFPRLRLGIGSPPPGSVLADYVLADPAPHEEAQIQEALALAVDAIALFVRRGPEAAMNAYNRGAATDEPRPKGNGRQVASSEPGSTTNGRPAATGDRQAPAADQPVPER